MADHAEARQQPRSARRFRNQAKDAADQANDVVSALRQAAQNTLQTVADDEAAADKEAAS
jgi:CHASE3 domain sensor protein